MKLLSHKWNRVLPALAILSLAVWAYAGSYQTASLLKGGTLILYNGTGNNANSFVYSDTYNTNRTYVNDLGNTVTPLATNSTTGEIYASFERVVEVWPLSTGAAASLSIQATVTCNTSFTNSVAFYIQKSVDGTYYTGPADTNYFVFSTPVQDGVGNASVLAGDTLVIHTNLSSTFLNGARYLRLWKIVGGANPTDDGVITVNSLKVGGWAP